MNIRVMKIDNCFAETQTYEYMLDITGGEFLKGLEGWKLRINEKLRRPVGIASRDGVIIKAALEGHSVRVSYPDACWLMKKMEFEEYLEKLG